MRIIFGLMCFLLSFNILAVTYTTRIEAIDYPNQISEEILVFLSTGHVAIISVNFLKELELLEEAKSTKSWLKITLNEDREIIRIEPSEAPSIPIENKSIKEKSNYTPTVLKSIDWANRYFKESKRKDKESQCFNRAHVWSYEWHKKHKFYSSKMFLFFTRKFIREHQFAWWFHVAPYIHVVVGNKIKERVMDIKYLPGPTTVGKWVKHFTKIEPNCLTVLNYSDYANYPENGNCYLMRASMFTYWPLDLENEELHGTMKTYWVDEEIKTAYLEAFDIVK